MGDTSARARLRVWHVPPRGAQFLRPLMPIEWRDPSRPAVIGSALEGATRRPLPHTPKCAFPHSSRCKIRGRHVTRTRTSRPACAGLVDGVDGVCPFCCRRCPALCITGGARTHEWFCGSFRSTVWLPKRRLLQRPLPQRPPLQRRPPQRRPPRRSPSLSVPAPWGLSPLAPPRHSTCTRSVA